ncbi:MAG: ribonucleoside triphosphate reductase [Fibrobacterota bacterium]
MHTVRKRDGRIEDYNRSVISEAIFKAAESVGGEDRRVADELAIKVEALLEEKFHDNSIPAVEQVQDIVEKVLIKNGHSRVAKAYILYREQHRKIRSTEDILLDIEHTMDGYLKKSDWRVNENSNVNYSLGGLILHNSGAITANYWLENIYTRDISQAHKNGDIHIHDLSMFSGYCAGWSLRQLLSEGLGGVSNKISSSPPKHLNTAMHQMVNFLGILQNEWAGAQAFSSLDTYLAPFVWVDNLSYEDVKQAMQSFIFGVNTPSRWGSQAPFTNVTFDWTVPSDLRDQAVVIGGKVYDKTYGDFQTEMNLINKAFLDVFIGGDADGRGFAYPIPTYNITKDFDWDGENTDLLFQMTGKYGTPYFQNFINSDLDPNDVRSMCCRLQLDKRELRKRGGGLFGADEFTGSIGVVTINLPRIAYLATSKDEFFRMLNHRMDIARDSLETKRVVVKRLLDQGLFPYTKRYLKHWDNHFSTIGLIGMNEAVLNFMGSELTDPGAREFAGEILDHMRERLQDYQEETGNLYNLEATPGEGTSYRLAKVDKETLDDIRIPGGEKPYYTNSSQLPVGATDNIFEALDMQDELQTKYTGGTVFHGFLGEEIRDIDTVRTLVKKITSGYRLPYFTISPTYSICDAHGYISGEKFSCPECGEETEVYSRIVGYYRPLNNWNRGKKKEYHDRITFKGKAPRQVTVEKS